MDSGHKYTERQLRSLEKKLSSVYKDIQKELEDDLEKVIKKLTRNNLTEEAIKRLSIREKDILDTIEKMSIKITNANREAVAMLENHLLNVYDINYNFGVYQLETLSGYDLQFDLYDKNAIKRLLESREHRFTKIALNHIKDQARVRRDLKHQFAMALTKGESIPQIAKRVGAVTQKNRNDSIRIARTETTRVQSQGRMDTFKQGAEKGLELKKQWISALDSRTRSSHIRVNGEAVGLEEKFSIGLEYPADYRGPAKEVVNCRCTIVTNFVGVERSASLQRLDKEYQGLKFEEYVEKKKKAKPKPKPKPKKEPTDKLDKLFKDFADENVQTKVKKEFLETAKNGNPKARKLFGDHIGSITQMVRTKGAGAFYSPSRREIHMNFVSAYNQAVKYGNGKGKFSTFYHEFGHHLSSRLARNTTKASIDLNLGKLLDSDVKRFLEVELPKMEGGTGTLQEKRVAMYKYLRGYEMGDISDIFGGLTGKVYEGDWGHTASYWKEKGINGVGEEFFAHYYSALFTNDISRLEEFDTIFPSATKAVREFFENLE